MNWTRLGLRLMPFSVVAGALVTACASDVVVTPPSSAHGGEGGEYTFIDPDPSVGGAAPASGPQSSTSTLSGFEDPGCTDTPPPIEDYLCDPYAQGDGSCAPGEACQIYVQYPDMACGQEIYGSYCTPAGPGQQGDPCFGGGECGAGLVCVITGSGTQCVTLCNLAGASGCPPGLVCEPIDVKGFGGCL